jgi:YbbR domain-containing protein
MAWHPFRNVGLKFSALALGALLWFTVTGEQVERKVTQVPIYYRNLSPALEITDQPGSVDVSIRGRYADISRIQDIAITADLGGAGAGANVLPLRVDQVTVPQGVDVVQIDPGTVTVWLERSDEMRVPIRPNIDGEPAPGFHVRETLVEPAMVTIVGPQSRLRPTASAVTERISIEGRDANLVRDVSVGVSDAQLRLRQPVTARVTVVIEPEPASRSFEALAIAFRNLPEDASATADPATVSVVLRGMGTPIASVAAADLRPFVDVAGLAPGVHVRDVRVMPPVGVEVAGITPATVTVTIR